MKDISIQLAAALALVLASLTRECEKMLETWQTPPRHPNLLSNTLPAAAPVQTSMLWR